MLFHLIRLTYLLTIFAFTYYIGSKDKRHARLVALLPKLGPSFIKLGQTLSVRPDIIGEEMANALAHLRDRLPPFSQKRAQRILEQELGKPLATLFAEFDTKPIAAASIAQVHKAKLHSGEQVAVKILRPRIERAFRHDLKLFFLVARMLSWMSSYKRLRPKAVVRLLDSSVRRELDLRLEAASGSMLRDHCKHDDEVYIPTIYWQRTSARVLTTEWVDGITIDNKEALKAAGHDLVALSHNLALTFFNQTYRDGFFHADIHQGNLFVNKQGKIVPIDFGIMGTLDMKTRYFLAEILRGFIIRDYMHVARMHFEAGYVPQTESMEEFALACRAIGEPIMGRPVEEISLAKLLALLFKITQDFNMETQPQLLLFQKTMVLIEGVTADLNPNINLWEQAEPWVRDWAKENLSYRGQIKQYKRIMRRMLLKLPGYLEQLEARLDQNTAR